MDRSLIGQSLSNSIQMPLKTFSHCGCEGRFNIELQLSSGEVETQQYLYFS